MTDARGSSDLAGSSWLLVEIGARLPPAEVEITLEFAATDVSGFSGCNRFAGGFHADAPDGSVSFGPLRSTRMACLDPAIGEVETAFLAALDGVRTVRLDPAGRLTISGAVGERLVFVSRRAAGDPAPPDSSILRTLALGLLTLLALAGHAFAGFLTLVLSVLSPDPGAETSLAVM